MVPLPNRKYKLIYADPPWSFRNKNTGGSLNSGANAKYSVMNLDNICNMPVSDIAAEDCALAMWWVASMPLEALRVVDAWGFTLKTMTGFNWMKKTKSGKIHFGMGFWTRQGSESCLIATRGKPSRESASVRAVIEAVNRKHSQKPPEARERLVELMGDVPRIELFARGVAPDGWDFWGDEVQ